ncbi:hypothetical protein D3C78_1863320 [compost metagenome]
MCQTDTCLCYLALISTPLQLLGKLDDLRTASGTDRMPFAQQAAGGIHGNATAQRRGPRLQ